MEKERFEEAEKQAKIIEACEIVIADNNEDEFFTTIQINQKLINKHIVELVFSDKQVKRSFLCWVENVKTIAEQKFKEI